MNELLSVWLMTSLRVAADHTPAVWFVSTADEAEQLTASLEVLWPRAEVAVQVVDEPPGHGIWYAEDDGTIRLVHRTTQRSAPAADNPDQQIVLVRSWLVDDSDAGLGWLPDADQVLGVLEEDTGLLPEEPAREVRVYNAVPDIPVAGQREPRLTRPTLRRDESMTVEVGLGVRTMVVETSNVDGVVGMARIGRDTLRGELQGFFRVANGIPDEMRQPEHGSHWVYQEGRVVAATSARLHWTAAPVLHGEGLVVTPLLAAGYELRLEGPVVTEGGLLLKGRADSVATGPVVGAGFELWYGRYGLRVEAADRIQLQQAYDPDLHEPSVEMSLLMVGARP